MNNYDYLRPFIPKLKDEIYNAILKYALSEYESEITDFDTELQYYKDCEIAGEIEKHISIYSNLLKDEEKYYRMKFSPKVVEHSLETILKEHCQRMKIDIDNFSRYEVYENIESPDRKFGPQQLCNESQLNGNNDKLYNVLKNNAIITKLAQHISLVQVLIELKRRKQENEENLQKANAKKVPERENVATMTDKVQMGNDITGQISAIENRTTTTEKQSDINSANKIAEVPKETKLDASHFIGFMNEDNKLKSVRIMNDGDYTRLLDYTQELMDYCRVPQNIKPIPKINLTKQEIYYTYNLIHNHQFPEGPRRKQYFVFLDSVFSQLHQAELEIDVDDNYQQSNTYKKFTAKPNRYHKLNKI